MLAVVLAVFTRSFQEGTYSKMIENAVEQFTGYVQVHQKNYWEDKTLDNGLTLENSLLKSIENIDKVESVSARIESFSLASNKTSTKGTLIIGIHPEKEEAMLHLKPKIIKGKHIQATDKSILLGSKLASYLKINVGDTLVLMGQGHWGQSAVGAFPVKGIIKMPSPILDKQIVYMPLALAQEYFSFENGASSLVIKISDPKHANEICENINSKIDTSQFKAMTWQEMSPELVQQIEGDKAGGILMIAILYMIIAFGVFGTVLMMTEERKKEFAVMIAIGTQKTKLLIISVYETLMINTIGVLLGIIFTIPLVYYYQINPIALSGEMAESTIQMGIEPVMPTILEPQIFINQIIIILVIAAIAALYPLFSIMRMTLIKSLRR
jgi:ABC-type lipoprotein release transport system permease subunit